MMTGCAFSSRERTMNAEQMEEIRRQANGNPQRMVELVVDHHLANSYGGDVNAYVDGLGRSADTLIERGLVDGIAGLLPFLMELRRRGADVERIRPILDRIMAAVEAASQAAAPPPAKATGARRLRKTKTGRRVRKGTRRGRKGK